MQIVIDDKKIIDLLEMEWGYEGIREDITRVIRENGTPLDKIREEIAEYGSICVAYVITDKTKTDKGIEKLVGDVLKQAKKQVLNVIDKHIAESEGEHG